MQHVVVDEVAVRALAMAAQPLAMVADDHQDRLVVETRALQPRHAAAHLLIGKRNLTVVEADGAAPAKFGRERLRRLVRAVRVVEMDPREERLVPL